MNRLFINKEWSPLKKLLFMNAASGGSLKEYTVTGNPVTFNTNVAKPLSQLLIPFTPVQSGSGDSSPTNVRPITGWTGLTAYRTGINLLDREQAELGTFNQSTGEKISGTGYQQRITYYIHVNAGEKYVMTNNISNNARAFFWKINGEYVGTVLCTYGVAFTVPNNAECMKLVSSSEGFGMSSEWQLEYGDTASTYSEYVGTTIPITFPAVGKNLFDESTVTIGEWADASGKITRTQGGSISDYIAINGGTSLCAMYKGVRPYSGSLLEYDEDKNFIKRNHNAWASTMAPLVVTLDSQTAFVRLQVFATTTTEIMTSEVLASEKIQLEVGSSTSAYEPFTNTVYGGTLDVTTGVLTVTYANYIFTEQENWQASSTAHRFYVYMTLPQQMAEQPMTTNAEQNVYTDLFGRCVYKNADGVAYFVTSGNNRQIVVNESSASSVSDIKSITTGMQMVYELETPITFQLTPQQITTLIGDNTVWTDTNGENTVKYLKKG